MENEVFRGRESLNFCILIYLRNFNFISFIVGERDFSKFFFYVEVFYF